MMTHRQKRDVRGQWRWTAALALGAGLAAAVMPACKGPLDDRDYRAELRQQLRQAYADVGGDVTEPARSLPHHRPGEEGSQAMLRRDEPGMGGIAGDEPARAQAEEPMVEAVERGEAGADDMVAAELSLNEALELALAFNIDQQIARLRPASAREQRRQAEAVFDPAVFSRFDWSRTQAPRPGGDVPGLVGDREEQVTEGAVGLRQELVTGGSVEVEQSLRRHFEDPSVFFVDRYYESELSFTLRQPLLRNFGTHVSMGQIEITRNLQRSELEQFRQEIHELAAQVESSYWELTFAHRQLETYRELLADALDEQERIRERAPLDATPMEQAEIASYVQFRRADLVRARTMMRNASDQLRRLLNAPRLEVAQRGFIVPTDPPQPVAVGVELDRALRTAMEMRPELEIALLELDDAQLRRRVAQNRALPNLDLVGQVGLAGLDERRYEEAIGELRHREFPRYRLGLEFEMPLGNREGRALVRQHRIEQQQAVLRYQRTVQDVALEVKTALRQVQSAQEQIGVEREARAAAEMRLRVIEAQEEAGIELTPTYMLERRLGARQQVAEARLRETQAMAEYRMERAELYQAMGTLLERQGIGMSMPELE